MGEGENRTITITGAKHRQYATRIPPVIDGLPVTAIAPRAFLVNDLASRPPIQLTSLVIPEGVTSIGYNAFSSNAIESLVLPESLTSLGHWAFSSNKLTSVIIPGGLTSLEEAVFWNNQLTSVTIPETVTSIAGSVFGDNKLTSIIIPGSVTSIGNGAFAGNELTSIVFPEGVSSIGNGTFSGNKLTSIVIPEGVTSIGDNAFAGNEQLKSITLPASVTSIGDGAFADAHGFVFLSSLTLPMTKDFSVAKIFGEGRHILGNLTITGGSVPDKAFADTRISSVTLLPGVTSVGAAAFSNNPYLFKVTIPEGLTNYERAFDTGKIGGYWITYGKGAGTYQVYNTGRYYHNGVPLSPAPARLFPGEHLSIGAGAGGVSYISDGEWLPVPPGVREISVHYYNTRSITRYPYRDAHGNPNYALGIDDFETTNGLTVLKETLVEGGVYDVTGAVWDGKLTAQIKKR